MKVQRLLIALTVLNFGLLIFLRLPMGSVEAQGVAPVLRGRELEIVDDHGRVRASLKVQPADPGAKKPDGESYSETVILRLIDTKGQPSVKLATSEQGAGLALVSDSDSTYIVLNAEGTDSSIKLFNKDGRQRLIQP